ncbi:polysaccharide lyase family 7 protein [Hyunsoonleella sp. SJ7]|uniref:Polysaccharide lyase family 7 protein n=1 Tax=Hyunsoonleella aquatilis TaxID=2762758 RepID=A0A923HDH9_9FLAO|nr:polysaccharide lyase family 7 protein [Hyunsoonleella aquatilis]MBC3759176.1 polysaccharide lyase family 7 protein [Hyunsoonleella aquatilis]
MNKKNITSLVPALSICAFLTLISCKNETKKLDIKEVEKTVYPSEIIPIFNHFKLVLGDGANVGQPLKYEHKDYFYTTNDDSENWVVYKSPNGGNTHGTSKNTRTELAQTKKWYPKSANDKLTATLKVMNVSTSGDATKGGAFSVVVGQIHSADGHENEPLKIYYKKFPGHTKGSVFWNYEINTKGDDNSGRWDYSTAVWGNDFSVVGADKNSYPEEPKEGIEIGEEFSYEVVVKDGIMNLKFTSDGHETKTFSKNIIESEYNSKADIPLQTRELYAGRGRDGVERENAYAGEGCFFKQGCYNQTNGVTTGGETYGGNIGKQYETGNYAEVWFNKASVTVSDASVSNEGYFIKND